MLKNWRLRRDVRRFVALVDSRKAQRHPGGPFYVVSAGEVEAFADRVRGLVE